MAKTHITAEPGMPQILISREFAAPREFLFRAYTDPELLVQWLGPRRLTMTIDRFDLRDGGTWRYTHRDTDGAEYGFHGVFHGTPGHVSLESLTFEEQGDRTLLRINSVYQSVEDRDAMIESGMEQGLNEGMERLDELLARRAPVR